MDEAPRSRPVAAPLPDDLRPCLVLHTEPTSAAPGERFAGWWVTAWKSALPCVQLDRARCTEVGRTVALARENDPGAVADALAAAKCFVAAEPTWLPLAARLRVPTVWLADGPPDRA